MGDRCSSYHFPFFTPIYPATHTDLGPGQGTHPHCDPWGWEFSPEYECERWKKAGSRLAGPYTFVLDGIQGDADFIAAMFNLKRHMNKIRSKFWNVRCLFYVTSVLGAPILLKPTKDLTDIASVATYAEH